MRHFWMTVLCIAFGGVGLAAFCAAVAFDTGASAQDTDAARITALETQVAGLTEDLASIREDYADQLLPEPRPVSDFTNREAGLSDDSITFFCLNYPLDDTHIALTCDQVKE